MALSAAFPESFLMITFSHRPTTASTKLFPSKRNQTCPVVVREKVQKETSIKLSVLLGDASSSQILNPPNGVKGCVQLPAGQI